MMLTPAKQDPNRDKELKRAKDDPLAFGSPNYAKLPSDWKPSPLSVEVPAPKTKT